MLLVSMLLLSAGACCRFVARCLLAVSCLAAAEPNCSELWLHFGNSQFSDHDVILEIAMLDSNLGLRLLHLICRPTAFCPQNYNFPAPADTIKSERSARRIDKF